MPKLPRRSATQRASDTTTAGHCRPAAWQVAGSRCALLPLLPGRSVDHPRRMSPKSRRRVLRGHLAVRMAAALVVAILAVAACGGVSPSASSPASSPAAPASAGSKSPSPTPAVTPATAQALLDAARQAHGAPGALALVRHGDERTFLASGDADTTGRPSPRRRGSASPASRSRSWLPWSSMPSRAARSASTTWSATSFRASCDRSRR